MTTTESIIYIIGIIVFILAIIYGKKLWKLCLHDPEKFTLGKTEFTYPVEAQYKWLSELVERGKDTPSMLQSIYETATVSLKWKRENKPVCPDKYYRLHIPGKDTNGLEFGTLYIRRDKP